MNDRAASYLACCVIFCVFTCILVPLRCYARIRSSSRLAAEDYIMIAAQAPFMLVCVGSFYMVANGLGKHVEHAPTNKDLEQALFCFFIGALLYPLVMFLARISIGMLLFRIMPSKRYKGLVIATMTLNIAATGWLMGWTLGLCRPISHFWHRWSPGSCKDKDYGTVGYIHSSCSIVIDWILSILPAYILYKSRLNLKSKIAFSIVLGLGVLASIATVVRLTKIGATVRASVSDFEYTIVDVLTWSVAEMGLTIMAGCAATFRGLFKPKKRLEESDGTRGRPGRPRQPGDTEVEWDPGLTIGMIGTVDEESGWSTLASPKKVGMDMQIETIPEERTDSRAPLQPKSDHA
ncbi:hypothetical protein K461DRAFT_119856 [Myriangium duriaei CBS 260.36]|uniref:Rhodopsin domain-containing protein n=1 Tax=Myriangium duriaei CBS 260.36 TaxID=1168546 RepID=A0A9P4J7R2_9PEZI|nr:hypothetical protein K461DRAFT_119856 [Myriangium duriaei CBS 260.36]